MTSSSESLSRQDKTTKNHTQWLRWSKYLVLGVIGNGAVWGLALFYLKHTPTTYTSQLVIHVAGSDPAVSVNLPNIGQANTSSSTSFGAHSDARENYKLIANSNTVLTATAKAMEITELELGEPNIEIINNTTLLSLEIDAKSPTLAQAKAKALYQALSERLNFLRTEEQQARNQTILKAVADTQDKLLAAQSRLSEYKAQSGFSSPDQIKALIGNIENLRQQRSTAVAQLQNISDRLQQLALNLKLSPQEAADALVLQTDKEFQQSLTEYNDAKATLTTLLPNRGHNYPDVVAARQKQQAFVAVMLKRGEILLGKPLKQINLERLNLDNSNGSGVQRSGLFKQLVTLQAEQKGLIGQVQGLTEQLAKLETKLTTLTKKESAYDNLLRDLQIAEAVFASTVTKLDLIKGDPFASYPLTQVIEGPSLPDEPSAPKPKLVLAGSLMGSILVTTGLTLIWWREPLVKSTKTVLKEIVA